MTMWQVSPVAFGPTMRFVETTLPVNGALFLYTLTGTSDWSQYGSASRKSCFFPFRNSIAVSANKAARAAMPPFFPANVIAETMPPAATTPEKMALNATAVGRPNKKAPIAPVQAPVPGRGIPTNAASEAHCRWVEPMPNSDVFDSALFKMGDMSFFRLSFRSKNNNGIIGAIFPNTQIGNTVVKGKPIQIPTGMAPRSSTTGSAEMMARTPKSGIPND
mmetsp:Transcript_22838/g.63504  ORF Transcript_22838/g.63504 Transcript_22838/m.63504 type:complete len:219 (-) Transcript_22838:411-1067(-)